MRPWFKSVVNALWNDEMAARRWTRGLLVGFGVAGAGAVQYAPERFRFYLFLGAGLAACVGGLINLGDKNPPASPPAAP